VPVLITALAVKVEGASRDITLQEFDDGAFQDPRSFD
jgi:hypothetical protein